MRLRIEIWDFSSVNEIYMLCCFLDCIPITPLLASHFVVDVGSVLKVVSITQENWSTEEVVLEELQVFQVLCSTRVDTSTNKETHKYSYYMDVCRDVRVCFTFHRFQLPSSAWRCRQNRFVFVIIHFFTHS